MKICGWKGTGGRRETPANMSLGAETGKKERSRGLRGVWRTGLKGEKGEKVKAEPGRSSEGEEGQKRTLTGGQNATL